MARVQRQICKQKSKPCRKKIETSDALIAKVDAEIKRLKESKSRTVTAQSLVEDHQASIENLKDQIGIKTQEKQLTEDQHKNNVEAAKKIAAANEAEFEKRIAEIADKIAKHDAELQRLAEGNHDVQEENKKARDLIGKTITDFETQIKELTTQIF